MEKQVVYGIRYEPTKRFILSGMTTDHRFSLPYLRGEADKINKTPELFFTISGAEFRLKFLHETEWTKRSKPLIDINDFKIVSFNLQQNPESE